MLETAAERVRFLKAGFNGREVEKLYVILNGIEVRKDNVLREGV
jgi:hypothetical protein